MGKRANIRAIRVATETAVWQRQATELRQSGAIPATAGAAEARRFTQAGAQHDARWVTRWVVFAVVFAVPGFAIAGASALWWLIPAAALLGGVHARTVRREGQMSEAQRARTVIEKQVWGLARWNGGQCTWCGSPVRHRDEHGRQAAPVVAHHTELADEVDRRVTARYGVDGR